MKLLPPSALRARFVDTATAKFARNVPDFVRLQALVAAQGGHFRNDHGAIRTADPQVCSLFERAARVLGLRRERRYLFPAKKLKSFDLQRVGDDAGAFKIFVSEVDLDAFPAPVAALVRADCAAQAAAVDHGPFIGCIDRFESQGGLDERDATFFVAHFVERLMSRNGPPLARATLDAVARISGEAASALALGPDFNHVTIDVRAGGFDGIEAMATAMRTAGFRLLPAIQGAAGTALRQTATMAATMDTAVLEADGSIGRAQTEKQFVEIIERAQARDDDGTLLWAEDGTPLVFRNFLATNAEKIFDAASTKAATHC
ncbi:2-oxoadipate dioxygenase/decarboxylase family protein [Solimonas terrae]|uniref:2-oxoadipate dioxygenase/decarboxylase family protein n=1 Tax=Solimonas terrae TaxID=1396819 RepID=UPI00344B94B0